MMAMPRPPSTLGKPVDLAYTRRPGLEIRRTPAMERSRFWPYFRLIDKVLPTWPSAGSFTVVARDVALVGQDLGDTHLDLAVRHGGRVVVRLASVPDPGQHVRNRVSHCHE